MAVEVLVSGTIGVPTAIPLEDCLSVQDDRVKITLPENINFGKVKALGGMISVRESDNEDYNIIIYKMDDTTLSYYMLGYDGDMWVVKGWSTSDITSESTSVMLNRIGTEYIVRIASASGSIGI